jgi:hypothetical protein
MASRSFGSLQWSCVRPGRHWVFDDGWGRFDLRHYNNRGQTEGWYLDTPAGSGDWMGRTLSEATQAAEPVILKAHPSKKR